MINLYTIEELRTLTTKQLEELRCELRELLEKLADNNHEARSLITTSLKNIDHVIMQRFFRPQPPG
ncbi:hypothetical protein [Hasllibacter sp. MH4015]|uniref:hypothetical protein n=1 Tax=Hasllibacter sp. MH4015 TaxID=2854029 RepID=UPI001CD555B8|nr:hypothetical protein [Hasllibacter sp. MH4015]